MEDILKLILERLSSIESDTKEIKETVNRIEASQQEDIKGVLNLISSKLETVSTKEDIEYLARKLGEHDLELDRLKRIR